MILLKFNVKKCHILSFSLLFYLGFDRCKRTFTIHGDLIFFRFHSNAQIKNKNRQHLSSSFLFLNYLFYNHIVLAKPIYF